MHVLLTTAVALLFGLLTPREASAQFNGCAPGFCGSYAGAVVGTCATSGYQGAGDVIPGAVVGLSVQAWTQALCGTKVANVCVSGTCADMLSSAANGAVVPQTINGTVCPAASLSACVVHDWYDQTTSSACSGSCDFVQYMSDNYLVLTTTCPSPLAVCLVGVYSGTAALNAAAGNISMTVPYTDMVVGTLASGGSGTNATYFGLTNNGGGIQFHPTMANYSIYTCNGGVTSISSALTDGTWHSLALQCETSTFNGWVNGSAIGSASSWSSSTISGLPYAGYNPGGASTPNVYVAEYGVWKSDQTSNLPSLYSDQHTRFGF